MRRVLFFLMIIGVFSPRFILSINPQGPEFDVRPRKTIEKEAKKIGEIYKIKLIGSGLGSVAGSSIAPWGLFFTSQERLTLEQSKILGKEVLIPLLQKMKEDPDFNNYYKEPWLACEEHAKRDGQLCRVNPKSLAFRIDFWDENVDRPLYPYCAEIRYADGVFYYYYADPKTQALQDPLSEVFQEREIKPVTS